MALSCDGGPHEGEISGSNRRLNIEEPTGDETGTSPAGDVNAIVQAYARMMQSKESWEAAQRLAEQTEKAINHSRL